MRIELRLPRGERQRHFLDYLNCALRSRTSAFSGSAGFGEDGYFRSKVTGPFPIDTAYVPLTWQLVKDQVGDLLYLEVACEDTKIPDARWTTAANELVTSALAAALSERRSPFFRRIVFFYIGPQLDGEYWLPGFRLAPALPKDPAPQLINAERVLVIDMVVKAIDDMNAVVLATEAARRHAAHLSLLLNVGLYSSTSEARWVLPVVDGKSTTESARYQLGFFHPSVSISEMPRKGELCAFGQYKGSLASRYHLAGELLSLPPQARRILRGVDLSEPLIADAFDRGARLYQVASVVGRQFPSVSLAYRIAAVDAIAQTDETTTSFGEFMRKYITSTTDLDSFLDYMWGSLRSAHFHAGEFPLGEFSRVSFSFDSPLMDLESIQLTAIHSRCYELTREAIVNWLTSVVPETQIPEPNAEVEADSPVSETDNREE